MSDSLQQQANLALSHAVKALRRARRALGLCVECANPAGWKANGTTYARCERHRKAAADSAERLRRSA